MINFFPRIYKDELLYSVIGRYHKYCGNISYKDTLREIFDTENVIPTLEFQSHLKVISEKLDDSLKITSDTLIKENTLAPIYFYFMKKKNVDYIKNCMINSDGKAIKYKLGMIAGGICNKEYIYYCPICSKEERESYGECYIHRNASSTRCISL